MARKASVARANELTGGFASAQKNIVVQFGDKERSTEDLLQVIKADALSKGIKDADFEKVDVYIKPEEHRVFYVINSDVNGSVEF